MTLTFSLSQRPIAKKNSRKFFFVRNRLTGGQRFISNPSTAYEKFAKAAGMELLQYKHYRFRTPVFISYVFYFKGKLSIDFDNAVAGINDLLQDVGILSDDKLIEEAYIKIIRGNKNWKTEVFITDYSKGGEVWLSKILTKRSRIIGVTSRT